MKTKKIISLLLLAAALLSLVRCTVYEVEHIDEHSCPGMVIDTVYIPDWEKF